MHLEKMFKKFKIQFLAEQAVCNSQNIVRSITQEPLDLLNPT